MVGDVFGDSGKQCWVMVMGVMFFGMVVDGYPPSINTLSQYFTNLENIQL